MNACSAEVAIKLLHPGISQAGAEILKAEAITTAALDHRDIVKVYDIEQIPAAPGIPKRLHGTFFMVLEYVPGTTLYCQLRDHGRSSVPQQTLQIWRELVAAIAFAHERNVIHRDLKPGNIIVQRRGLRSLILASLRPVSASMRCTILPCCVPLRHALLYARSRAGGVREQSAHRPRQAR